MRAKGQRGRMNARERAAGPPLGGEGRIGGKGGGKVGTQLCRGEVRGRGERRPARGFAARAPARTAAHSARARASTSAAKLARVGKPAARMRSGRGGRGAPAGPRGAPRNHAATASVGASDASCG